VFKVQDSGDPQVGRKDDNAEQWVHQFCNSNNKCSALRAPSNCQGTSIYRIRTCDLCKLKGLGESRWLPVGNGNSKYTQGIQTTRVEANLFGLTTGDTVAIDAAANC
jgi:hypothetical protein